MMALISTPEMDNFAGVVAGERMSARAYHSQKPFSEETWRPYDSLYSGILMQLGYIYITVDECLHGISA